MRVRETRLTSQKGKITQYSYSAAEVPGASKSHHRGGRKRTRKKKLKKKKITGSRYTWISERNSRTLIPKQDQT